MWDTLIINPMLNLLLWMYSLIGNFGVAIIIFTVLIRLLTHPLMVQQIRGQQKLQSFQSSPEYLALQKKYKDNKQMLQQEQAKLFQEMGVNPLASCLPLVIQFPIIIGLYQSITKAMATTPLQMADLYQHLYPFTNVPNLLPVNNTFLWMNLGQPERLQVFGVGIPVLAIFVVLTTFLQTKLMTPPPQPGADQTSQMTTQMMNLYMPFLMGWLAWSFASGLAVYFVTTNLATILQYALLGKLNWSAIIPGMKPPAAPARVEPKRDVEDDRVVDGPGVEPKRSTGAPRKDVRVRKRK
jgi:YidC/Oxa1 family membrane protein insertase